MKTILIMLTIACLAATANAQTKPQQIQLPKTLIMPDGSRVPSRSLDSIKKVFGGRGLILSFQDDGVHVHPQENKAEQLESDQKLNSHLNKAAPGFELRDMNGSPCSLSALKGKIVVLNFWFTQCGGCITEMPDLNALKKSYAGKDVVFLAITWNDDAKVKAFLTTKQFDYTIIPNAAKLCKDYDIDGYPTSIVIDRTGIVKFINSSIDADIKKQLSKVIDTLL